MPCQSYKDALMEAAAGCEAHGDLRAHLAECAECRAAFEQERALYAAIDAGVFVGANAEVPTSLLPRMRARLDEVSQPRRGLAPNWLVWASVAAAVVVGLLAARALWPPKNVPPPTVATIKGPLIEPPAQNQDTAVKLPTKENGTLKQQFVSANHTIGEIPMKQSSMPEVLVPRDQEVLLAEYAAQLSNRKHPALLAQGFDAADLSLLQVAPIQIDELGVKPLADEKAQ